MAMEVMISLPEEALSIFRSTPEDFVKEMRLAAAIKWYEQGRISQSKASELASISRQQFLDALARYDVSPFQVTPSELAQELNRD